MMTIPFNRAQQQTVVRSFVESVGDYEGISPKPLCKFLDGRAEVFVIFLFLTNFRFLGFEPGAFLLLGSNVVRADDRGGFFTFAVRLTAPLIPNRWFSRLVRASR
jgi:hypothetical protein